MKNESVWNSYLKKTFNKLKNDLETDVLIVGGGIAGVLSAFYLKDSNLKVTLVERNKILTGVTSKMTAKVTILQDILTKIKDKNLELYLKSQLEGLNLLKNNINNLDIECDFYKNDSYLWTNKKTNVKKLKKLEKYLNNLKINYNNENIPIKEFNSLYSIKTANSYEINPLKYLNGILDNLNNIEIYEKTNIIEVVKENKLFVAKTDSNEKIFAKKIIFATNYPYFLKPLFFPIKVRLERSNIIYGKSLYLDKYNLINIDKNIQSIRFYKNKMIYLSDNKYISHINGKEFNKINNSYLIENIDNYWSNMDIITNNYLPIIGEVFKNMYIITGFNTWGILSSHVGASLISSLILGKKKNLKYKDLFNPKMTIDFQKFINSSINILESMNGYFKGIISKNKFIFYSSNEAIFIDSKGNSHIVKRKCPHMKCHLIFNEKELTWDCPCHGSRFDIDGNTISGPSKYNIKD